MAKSNSFDAISKQNILMRVTGMWPKNDKSVFYKTREILSWFFNVSVLLMLFVELLCSTYDYNVFSDVLSLFISPFAYVTKHIAFLTKAKVFIKMLDKLNDPIFSKYPDHLDKYMKEGIKLSARLSYFYQSCCGIVVILYSWKPFFTENYELPFGISIVDDLGNYKYLAHFWESIGIYLAAYNNSCFDIISCGLMIIAAAHFDILHDKLCNVRTWVGLGHADITNGFKTSKEGISDTIDAEVSEAISECVKYHMTLFEFLELVEEIFSFMNVMQFANSIVVICNVGFQIAHTPPMSLQFAIMLTYFTAMMFQLALYCWFGNELMLKSLKIGQACYTSDWPNAGPTVRKSLFIIMERAKKPFYLTAGKIANLSLESYTSVLHSSYSYFALMQRLYANEIDEMNSH